MLRVTRGGVEGSGDRLQESPKAIATSGIRADPYSNQAVRRPPKRHLRSTTYVIYPPQVNPNSAGFISFFFNCLLATEARCSNMAIVVEDNVV